MQQMEQLPKHANMATGLKSTTGPTNNHLSTPYHVATNNHLSTLYHVLLWQQILFSLFHVLERKYFN